MDRYNDVFTLQVLTQAMDREEMRTSIVESLIEQFGKKINVVERSEPRIRQFKERLARLGSF